MVMQTASVYWMDDERIPTIAFAMTSQERQRKDWDEAYEGVAQNWDNKQRSAKMTTDEILESR